MSLSPQAIYAAAARLADALDAHYAAERIDPEVRDAAVVRALTVTAELLDSGCDVLFYGVHPAGMDGMRALVSIDGRSLPLLDRRDQPQTGIRVLP